MTLIIQTCNLKLSWWPNSVLAI